MKDDKKTQVTNEIQNIPDLFRYPLLRRRALIMYVNWFANSFILYGLALNWQSVSTEL